MKNTIHLMITSIRFLYCCPAIIANKEGRDKLHGVVSLLIMMCDMFNNKNWVSDDEVLREGLNDLMHQPDQTFQLSRRGSSRG